MNSGPTIKVILAIMVLQELMTREQANRYINRMIRNNYTPVPDDFDKILEMFEEVS